MKNSFFLIIILYFSFPAISQSIKGNVKDNVGNPLPFANILLLNSTDSTLIKGIASDVTGAYGFDNVNPGKYLFAATMVGYQTTYSTPININGSSKDIEGPLLILSSDVKLLKEVTVETTRPFIEQEIDRTIVNVANSIIASGSTALEVLEKAPGVILDRQNDVLSMRGKEGVIVQIDGKQTYLAMADVVALLRSMPSDNIEKIELITNPSAKYDAAGSAGIINIRMKKNNNVGTNGSVSVAGGAGRYDRERGSFQINHRRKNINLFGNYSINRSRSYFDFKMFRDQEEGGERNFIYQHSHLKFFDIGQNFKSGLDYFIGKNTTIGFVWTGFMSDHQEIGFANAEFRHQEQGPVYLKTSAEKTYSEVPSNHVVNLNLQHTFRNNGGTLNTDVDYGKFQREYSNGLNTATLISNEPLPGPEVLFLEMPTIIDIFTFKTDYSLKLSEKWKIETGVKRSSIRSDNNMILKSGPPGELQVDPELSNHFLYTEQVNALYSSISGNLTEKTEIQAGLRVEHTHSIGHSIYEDQIIDRNYLNLFPSIFTTRKLSERQNLTFSYSYRIDRPDYQSLNPNRGYIDPYVFRRGNSFLKPQFTHAMEFKYGHENKVFASLGVDLVSDYVLYMMNTVDSQRAEYTPENTGNMQAYNITISFPLTIMIGWTFQGTFMGLYNQTQYQYKDISLSLEQISGRLNGSNAIILGKGWTAEVSGWVSTPARYAMFRAPWLGSLDAGLQKAIGSNWKVKLSGQDLLYTNRFIRSSDVPGFSQNFHIMFDTRVVMLNVTYSFGNHQLKGTRQRRIGSEEEMRRAN